MDKYRPFDTQLQGPHQHLGSDILLHFLQNKHECLEHPHLLPRIPRRLGEKLRVAEKDVPQIGWGMSLIDQINYGRAFWNGLVLLLACLPPGFAWFFTYNNEIQGGTGITACMMGFALYFVGAWRFLGG